MKDLAIYGYGGHGREVACLINHINKYSPKWNLIGFFDDGFNVGESNQFGKVLGGIEELTKFKETISIVIAIADIKSKIKIVDQINNRKIEFPNIIAPDVLFFDHATFSLGKGNLILFNCQISCDVHLGDFNLLNGNVVLGHDAILGNFNTLMPSTRISGNCKIGERNFFGLDSVMLQGIEIGDDTRIGAASLLSHNTQNGHLYHGNPAKKMT